MTTEEAGRTYALDNAHDRAEEHHRLLGAMWDRFSAARMRETTRLVGKRCLELGAGGGTFARWMAEEVGAAGFVLACDAKPLDFGGHPNMEVRQHDLTSDEALPDGFHVVHARLTLAHVENRVSVLGDLAKRVLSPGGVLCVEDWRPDGSVMHAPTPADRLVYGRVQRGMTEVFKAAGTDPVWAADVNGYMRDFGLRDVVTVMHAEAWAGGSQGARLVAGTVHQLWDQLRARGLTESELNQTVMLLEHPDFVVAGHLMHSTTGKRPGAGVPEADTSRALLAVP